MASHTANITMTTRTEDDAILVMRDGSPAGLAFPDDLRWYTERIIWNRELKDYVLADRRGPYPDREAALRAMHEAR